MSEHPLPTHALGEVVGQVLEQVGPSPDFAVLFATGGYIGAVEDLASTIRRTLAPRCLIGCTAGAVLAGDREVEDQAALVLFAGDWQGRMRVGGQGVRAVRFEARRHLDGWLLNGTDDVAVDGATLVLLADPFSFPVDGFLAELNRRSPALTIVGGLASAGAGPGGNRLIADEQVVDSGAVGLFLPPGVPVSALVSQGCRPVGEAWVVTAGRDNLLEELGGRPALDRVLETADAASPDDRNLMARGLQVGLVVDESKDDLGTGDFLVRSVLGADKTTRAVAVGADVAVGSTVQFQVSDALSADEDLRHGLSGCEGRGALVFLGNGRGAALFGMRHHDAMLIDDHIDGGATAGMFCAGEVGPVGGQAHVHNLTASMLLFD